MTKELMERIRQRVAADAIQPEDVRHHIRDAASDATYRSGSTVDAAELWQFCADMERWAQAKEAQATVDQIERNIGGLRCACPFGCTGYCRVLGAKIVMGPT